MGSLVGILLRASCRVSNSKRRRAAEAGVVTLRTPVLRRSGVDAAHLLIVLFHEQAGTTHLERAVPAVLQGPRPPPVALNI